MAEIQLRVSTTNHRRLHDLARMTEGKALENLAMAAALPIANRAAELAPVRDGHLRRDISLPKVVERTKDYCIVVISSSLPYANIQEFGGIITPKVAKLLSWIDPDTGERIFARSVHIPAHPYMRPAFRQMRSKAVEEQRSLLEDLIADTR